MAVYLTLGVTLDALGQGWLATLLILALCACCDQLGRMDGIHYGAADGLRRYLSLTEQEQAHVRELVKKWGKDA